MLIFYCLAHENTGSKYSTVNFNDFDEVWQSGSALDNGFADDDPIFKQDGVAPHCQIAGIIGNGGNGNSGRAFIPDQTELNNDKQIKFKKGFLSSHYEENYQWIFKVNVNEPGYVRPKN